MNKNITQSVLTQKKSKQESLLTHEDATILIIDKNLADSSLFAERLAQLGYHVVQCSSLATAQAEINTCEPNCIVTELYIDGGSGFDIVDYVTDFFPDIALLFLTNDGGKQDVVRALRYGVVDYIGKQEASFDDVCDAVAKALVAQQVQHTHKMNARALRKRNLELRDSLHIHEQDQIAGRLIQQRFLPASPQRLAGIDIDFKIIPSFFLSGDAIDFGLLNDRYLAFYLTDISGHGAASAFVAVWVRQLVRGLFKEQQIFHDRDAFERDAPVMMQHINEAIIKAELSQHLTCFVGVIDTVMNDMVYVVAGHLPLPVLVHRDGTQVLHGEGKPLGVFPDASWQMQSLGLPDSYDLMLFSDGVLETLTAPDLVQKEAQLTHLLTTEKPENLDALLKSLSIKNFQSPPDDITMLFIQKKH